MEFIVLSWKGHDVLCHWVCGFPPQWHLQHGQPGALQRFIRIHLHLGCLGEHVQLRHSGTGCESPLREGRGGERPVIAFIHLKTLTSRVAKRACCCGLSGLTLTVWLDLNSWSSESLLQAWTAPWPRGKQQRSQRLGRRGNSWSRANQGLSSLEHQFYLSMLQFLCVANI